MDEFLLYWRENFGEFEIAKGVFSIPGFPEPMMSLNFNHLPSDVFIGKVQKIRVQKESLKEASESTRYWKFLKNHYPDSIPFLEKLLPFLLERGHPHSHYFIENEGQLLASQLVGLNSRISFLFNGVVHQDYRQQGLLKEILNVVRCDLPSDEAFYWTKHEWLRL